MRTGSSANMASNSVASQDIPKSCEMLSFVQHISKSDDVALIQSLVLEGRDSNGSAIAGGQ